MNARIWDDDWAGVAVVVAFGCAAFLMLAIVAPSELARTSWAQLTWDGGTTVTDDPAGYVGLVTLCGVAALVALITGVWLRRVAFAAALAAAVAFAFGAYVTIAYWLGFPRGERLLEGQAYIGGSVEVRFPLLLPVFALAAVVGLVCTLVLVIRRLRQPLEH